MSEITRAWAARHMPRVARAVNALPDMSGIRLAMSMHLDMKMLPLVEGLARRGADLFITTCNPATVRNDVVAAMRACGAQVAAEKDMPEADWQRAIAAGLDWSPTHLCEMGSDYTHYLLKNDLPMPDIKAGLEATGSGINRLQGNLPPWPIFNWDDLPVKEGLHNRHMVGLTTWNAFFSRTLLSLHEKNVLVVGYGSVGQGLAASAKAFGGTVMVAEIDPARRLQARYDGWQTGTVAALAPEADVIVTGTGGHHVVPFSVITALKDGCILLNSGHRIDEIELGPLSNLPSEQSLPAITTYQLPSGAEIHLFVGGAMANLTGGEGDSLNAFDMTLAVMAEGIGHIVGEGEKAQAGVYLLPRSVWERACPEAD
ncbi:adenosylhomocysteinase [Martelella mediterranea]|uniref:Adenosylhomocysteinase n=1 Tax=Martelella mediterranea TaxID=293089 RepID=A0A4R3NYV7_9HYPH|nr:adenosylhomocysteinase [Martelella mediterranea]TCT44613.1 adenosylhomocysteinase [Martelella mediterranea]